MSNKNWRSSLNVALSLGLLFSTAPMTVSAEEDLSQQEASLQQEGLKEIYLDANYKTGKLMVHDASVSITLEPGADIKNGVVVTGDYAEFHGDGFADTPVTIKPKNAGAVVDFNNNEISNVVIEGDMVAEVRGAENIEEIEYVKGANPENIHFPKPFDLTIMHTNDTHANLDNIAETVTAVNEVRAEKADSLLLSAGDVFSGTLYFNEFLGQADLQFMNLMGYDAMTFGNHEFDLGSTPEGHQGLVDFIEGAQFPFVSSNVDFSQDEKFTGLFSDLISSEPEDGKIYNGIIKEVDGQKVGIFGLTTAETESLSSPGAISFSDYLEEAEKAVEAFEGQGVDKIIALTHIGYDDNAAVDNDLTLAAEVDGIDVIVGGHSHTALTEPAVVTADGNGEEKDPTVIVQAGGNNSYLGVLDVQFDENGTVIGQAGELIAIGSQEEDPEAAAMLEPYQSQINEVAQTEIGATATAPLENPRTNGDNTAPSVRKNETPLGNLITDGMLAKAKEVYSEDVIMALQNGGGIRAAIDEGPITVGEVITVLPFGNTLAVMDITGAELKAAFEHSLQNYPNESGGFLHLSGGQLTYDSSKPAGQRVVSVSYQDENGNDVEIQDDVRYTIPTNAFTAQGGDGFDMFAAAYAEGRVTDLGLSDWSNFAEHLVDLGTITPEVEGRIVDKADQN
ncbi:bifunctional metallophosphatase/5'-nucleotidase [Oceanobacillus damuensis]|uniref:bifunctional metallophosphatase/5'-nucleotidase n=1 Tax=Oceanobacillus damuensis TaxID=937928 RepID=UPI000A893B0F|nr:5'-nucleotidase C-terminal domain-containing protein [Oceanobacillus damuensis]